MPWLISAQLRKIVTEVPDFLQVFSDGSVKRFDPPIISASTETNTNTGCRFKDVVIESSKPITARIFLPCNLTASTQDSSLPVLVYFHGGGFCIGSTTWSGYHHFLADLSVTSNCIILSVDYRLAPENRLPVAYEDCFASLEWLAIRADPWLNRADLSRVFLSGDSAGGNIAHNVALLVIKYRLTHLKIRGILLIHPYFGSEKRTKQEMAADAVGHVKMNDMFWQLSLPRGSTRDHFACNYETETLSEDDWRQFPAVVVYVAGLDFLKERGVMYVDFMRKKQVEVMLVEAEDERHVYHVFHPDSQATRLLQHQMTDFMNRF